MKNQTTLNERIIAICGVLQQTKEISTALSELTEISEGARLEDLLSLEVIAAKFSDVLTDPDVLLSLRVLIDNKQLDETDLHTVVVPE